MVVVVMFSVTFTAVCPVTLMNASYSYLRQFVPLVLAAIDFQGGPGTDELMRALAVLAELSRTGTRKVPAGAPDGFVPARFRDYLSRAQRRMTTWPTATTGSCACCWACVTGCARGTCSCPGRVGTPTRARTCSRRRCGRGGGRSSVRLSASRPGVAPRWSRAWRSCTTPWASWSRPRRVQPECELARVPGGTAEDGVLFRRG